MTRILGISALLLFCIGGWKLGASISNEAVGMALSVMFGMMAGIPAVLIALVAAKNNEQRMHHEHTHLVIVESPSSPSSPLVQTMMTLEPRQKVTVVNEHQQLVASVSKRLEVLR